MALYQFLDETRNTNGHLRYESLLKALPPDILRELAKRKLEEIAEIRKAQKETSKPSR
ncbi:MAG: hypothetical protein LBG73_06705 [Spirochaetaceae bacterium]|jgi:hypothetical protein|nr:hypothetical protein [Spirochaetaceae bacterium]